MKLRNKKPAPLSLALIAGTLSGCVALSPPPPAPAPVPEAPETGAAIPEVVRPAVVVKVNPPVEGSCGSLRAFVIDAQKLEQKARKELLDKLSSYDGPGFSCDRLKTGLLLSQIGKTVSEDSLAIEILQQYTNADKLDEDNKQLVQLLLFQSKERKRLHVLLSKLGERLVNEKSLTKTLSTDLLTLQQKINQLQKLETDINETEQSIATPSTSSLEVTPQADTGS